MTCPDDTNLACIVVSSYNVTHVSVMTHMSMFPSSSIDCSILVLLTIDLGFIRQHFMLVTLPVLCLVALGPEVPLTSLGLITCLELILPYFICLGTECPPICMAVK